jgi:hypothetical protein
VLINERTHDVLLKPVWRFALGCVVLINERTHGVLLKAVLYLIMGESMVFCLSLDFTYY